jgi:hypothetical protein
MVNTVYNQSSNQFGAKKGEDDDLMPSSEEDEDNGVNIFNQKQNRSKEEASYSPKFKGLGLGETNLKKNQRTGHP